MRAASVILRACAAVAVAAAPFASQADHFNGGRTVPIHRLAPLDADGDKISPSAALPEPISQAKTCAQCHDVHLMPGGSHFRTGLDTNDAPESVTVEPWFWIDEKMGTAIPLTLHGQAGAFRPAEIGLSCWQWTKMFGRSFPGGGIGSDPRALDEVACERQRWFVTGPLGPNCLACHQQSGYDSSEWARQVLRENFAGAATAASGLGAVEGMNERLDSTWDGLRAENPDDHLFKVPEKAVYDKRRFDEKNRCVFDVGRPKSANCLACHGVSEAGVPSHAIAGDVHLQRGLSCVDCHKNGMDHRLTTTSCRECHIEDGRAGARPSRAESKGAGPTPKHAGIPLVHFEKLSCTVCHSGVTRGGARAQVRTARANRIGIYGRAQWATDVPNIVEPVFVKNAEGKIEPHRMAWPSYFAELGTNDTVKPLAPEAVAAIGARGTNAFTKAVVAGMLTALKAKSPESSFGFVGHGRLWTAEGEGTNATVVAREHKAAAPVAWPVGHDVRPARQSRGAAPAKCADCHTSDSEFFFGKVVPTGPVVDAEVEPVQQTEFLGLSPTYHAVLGTTFAMRPIFKVFLWSVFGLLCLFAFAASAVVLNRLGAKISEGTLSFAWGFAKWIVDMGFVLSLVYLALSGVIGWMCGGMTGWWLVLHMVAGGCLAGCAALLAVFRAFDRTKKLGQGIFWLFWLVCAVGTVFTAVMPMMTVYGGDGQEFLLWGHRLFALAFAVVSGLVCRCCCRRRR